MIIFSEYGRLGNQLFQYAYFTNSFRGHRIILFGFDQLRNVFTLGVERQRVHFLSVNFFSSFLYRILHLAAILRLIGVVYEKRCKENYSVRKRRGALWGTYLVMPSFFQHESLVTNIKLSIQIKVDALAAASQLLQVRSLSNPMNLVFLHVRRGDYLSWPSKKHPAALSSEWYMKAAAYIDARVPDAFFILVTDDPIYCKRELASILRRGMVSGGDEKTDFSLMTLCGHGIMSASTFSWWGAWHSMHRNKINGALFIAPEFWIGHGNREWHPPGFKSNWITYL